MKGRHSYIPVDEETSVDPLHQNEQPQQRDKRETPPSVPECHSIVKRTATTDTTT